jgi:voltage-gated potassium channel
MDEEAEYQSLLNEHKVTQKQVFSLALVALLLLCTGAVFFHHFQKLDWINAFYFCTVTLTTVGYGDITPTTDMTKLFDIFYILIGIGIVASFANVMVKGTITRRQLKLLQKSRVKKHKKN